MSIMGYVGKTAGERLKDESKHSSRKDFLDHYLEIQRTNPEIPAWYCTSTRYLMELLVD